MYNFELIGWLIERKVKYEIIIAIVIDIAISIVIAVAVAVAIGIAIAIAHTNVKRLATEDPETFV